MQKKRFIILDPGLKNSSGHNWLYNYQIAKIAIKKGFDVMILANKNCPPIDSIKTIPLFNYQSFVFSKYTASSLKYKIIINRIISICLNKKIIPFIIVPIIFLKFLGKFKILCMNNIHDGFSGDLYSFFKANYISDKDYILITDITFLLLCELWWLLSFLPIHLTPNINIIFHHDLFLGKLKIQYLLLKRKVLYIFNQKSHFDQKVRFLTTTEELKKQYQHILKNVLVIPAPHKYFVNQKNDNSIIRIAFLGGGRVEKGFHCLNSLLNFFEKKDLKNVRFLIQINLGDSGLDNYFSQKYSNYKFVDIYPGILSHKKYYQLLSKSHIVLLPYSVEFYKAKLSGILVEAIGSEKVVVVPNGTTLSRLSENGGSVVYEKESAFPLAVKYAVDNYSTLSQKAHVYGAYFRSLHNPENFLQSLFTN